MARTYWAPKGQGWEFLGSFQNNHQATPKTPQAEGSILDITDLAMREVLTRLGGRALLVGLPASIRKHLQTKRAHALPWAQIEGYLK